jgi:hypothetical protein
MVYRLKSAAVAAALMSGVVGLGGAATAQTANSLGGATFSKMDATSMSSVLGEFGITTELRASQRPGGAPVMVATTDGGAKFMISFFNCLDAASAQGCDQMMVSTAQPSAGIEFADLNLFNGTSNVTTAVYDPNSQILIFGRNVFMPGGVGRENLKLQVYLFLQDMQTFVSSRSGAGVASISFDKKVDLKSKIIALTAEPDAPAPFVRAGAAPDDRSLEIELAIANSTGVTFNADKK